MPQLRLIAQSSGPTGLVSALILFAQAEPLLFGQFQLDLYLGQLRADPIEGLVIGSRGYELVGEFGLTALQAGDFFFSFAN
jgi:hypothetical protein